MLEITAKAKWDSSLAVREIQTAIDGYSWQRSQAEVISVVSIAIGIGSTPDRSHPTLAPTCSQSVSQTDSRLAILGISYIFQFVGLDVRLSAWRYQSIAIPDREDVRLVSSVVREEGWLRLHLRTMYVFGLVISSSGFQTECQLAIEIVFILEVVRSIENNDLESSCVFRFDHEIHVRDQNAELLARIFTHFLKENWMKTKPKVWPVNAARQGD